MPNETSSDAGAGDAGEMEVGPLDCDPPYQINSEGIKLFKVECL